MISYFFVGICILFLLNKDPNISHPFVKGHVKSAFILHIMLAWVLFIMSYPFLDSIQIYNYSLNSIITASALMLLFAWILHGMYMAHIWKRVTLWEIFKNIWVSNRVMQKNVSEEISEDSKALLITAHIPLIWYLIYPENKTVPHIRDIVTLNFLASLLALFIFIIGYSSLASLIILGYTVWSVFSGVKLVVENTITTPNLDYIPTAEEKYILQKSALTYIYNTLTKKSFTNFTTIVEQKNQAYAQRRKTELAWVKWPHIIFMRNIIMLVVVFIIALPLIIVNSKVLLLFLFPVFFLIGYKNTPSYIMPYVYDIFIFIRYVYRKTIWLFVWARKLQKTNIKETIKIGEETQSSQTSEIKRES